MSELMPGLPGPALEVTTAGYWLAAGERRLVIQRCDACGTHRHPPTEVCYACQSLDWSWDAVPGTGRVYTYTWTDRPIAPRALLEDLGRWRWLSPSSCRDCLITPVRLLTRVVDLDRDDLVVDLAVVVDFDRVDEQVALPVFRRRL